MRTISFGNDEDRRKSRSELLGLMPVTDRTGLFELADKNWCFASILEDRIHECAIEGTNGDADWQVWLGQASDDAAAELIALANDWIEDDADESDWELADLRGYSDRGAALAFFRDQFEFCDTFNVVIVEGDHPGSSYFAAELPMDVDDANAMANQQGIPIRKRRPSYGAPSRSTAAACWSARPARVHRTDQSVLIRTTPRLAPRLSSRETAKFPGGVRLLARKEIRKSLIPVSIPRLNLARGNVGNTICLVNRRCLDEGQFPIYQAVRKLSLSRNVRI